MSESFWMISVQPDREICRSDTGVQLQIAKNFLTLNMLTKEQVIGAINKLPEEFSVEQAIDELILLEKIETGLEQSKADDVIPDEQLDKELPEWLR